MLILSMHTKKYTSLICNCEALITTNSKHRFPVGGLKSSNGRIKLTLMET